MARICISSAKCRTKPETLLSCIVFSNSHTFGLNYSICKMFWWKKQNFLMTFVKWLAFTFALSNASGVMQVRIQGPKIFKLLNLR